MMWRYCKLPFYQFTSFLHFYTVWYGLVIFFWLTNKSLLFTIYPARNLASHFSILYIYRSLFFIMLLYFLKMVQSFHIKFFYICFYIWYMFLVLLIISENFWSWKTSATTHFGLFWVSFWWKSSNFGSCSIISYKSFYRCFLYYSNGYCIKKTLLQYSFLPEAILG